MRVLAPAAALLRPVVANLRRGRPKPPDAPIPEGLWSHKLLDSYPYKLARRANPPRRKPKRPPDSEVRPETADAAADKLDDGPNGFISKGRSRLRQARTLAPLRAAAAQLSTPHAVLLRAQGSFSAAMRFAMFALCCTEAKKNATLRSRAHELLLAVQQTLILLDWRNAVAQAAAAEDAAESGGDGAQQRHSRGKASSTRKPRQGWTKAQMRELNARMCCACRVISPRALMWRIMHIKLPAQPGAVIKPRRQRRVRHRTVWLSPVRVPGKPAAAPKAAPAAAAAEAMPEGSLGEKKAKLKALRAAEAAESRGKVVILRLPGGASQEAQADQAVWAQPARGVRSVYVCRNPACVRASVKLKARMRHAPRCHHRVLR